MCKIRLRLLFTACLLVVTLACAFADTPLTTRRVASGLSRPLFVGAPPGDTERLFIVEQHTGRIKILNLSTETVSPSPFLIVTGVSTGNEQGLLGLSFHPDYASNGFFYVNFTDSTGATHVTRYQVSGDPAISNVADASSASTVITYVQPASNHNGGWLGFGPNDGLLYVSSGDGGANSSTAQDITDQRLGKVLRLDVNGDDFPADPNRNYAIPPANPFVSSGIGDGEIWAYGLRNPWRNSFDRQTFDLYIGDVGQSSREEIDFQLSTSGGGENYGWPIKEGTLVHGDTTGLTLVDPIYEYDHTVGIAVTGGYVYRGAEFPALQGTYFFGDYGTGQIWSFRYDGTSLTGFAARTSQLVPDVGTIDLISSFGEDTLGNLYIVDLDGEVFRLTAKLKPGDGNADGFIDSADLAIWQQHYDPLGKNADSFPIGDWDGNGHIDSADLALWQRNYAPLGYSGGTYIPEVVPEPATLTFLLVGTLALAGRRHGR